MNPSRRAFTILEILSIVAILGALLALSFPALEKVRPPPNEQFV